MGFKLTGTVIDKTQYHSKKKDIDVFELHIHIGGSDIVTVTDVKPDVWGAIQTSEVLTLDVNVRAFSDGQKGRLFVSYVGLA